VLLNFIIRISNNYVQTVQEDKLKRQNAYTQVKKKTDKHMATTVSIIINDVFENISTD